MASFLNYLLGSDVWSIQRDTVIKKIIQVDSMNTAQSSNSRICSQANNLYASDKEESTVKVTN